eukprot:GHVT01061271.1.p2 GENE.GHVT01061271.1~~GHVT01061271.1.p2  ORF type:complete len:460 (+),score=47.08 GHVT01061271.1:4533-5912(+)
MSSISGPARFSFEVEWYDEVSGTCRRFLLIFFREAIAVELHDLPSGRTFLKQTACTPEEITEQQLYVGNCIYLLGRHLKLSRFGDEATRQFLDQASRAVLLCLAPVFPLTGSKANIAICSGLIQKLLDKNLIVVNAADPYLGEDVVETLMSLSTYCPRAEQHGTRRSSKDQNRRALVLEVMGIECHETIISVVTAWHLNAPHIEVATLPLPPEAEAGAASAALKAVTTTGPAGRNDTTCKHDDEESLQLRNLRRRLLNPPPFNRTDANATCVVIKPHAMKHAGSILQGIVDAGFCIEGMQVVRLSPSEATEILEVYRTVITDFGAHVKQLASGPALVLVVSIPAEFVPGSFSSCPSSSAFPNRSESDLPTTTTSSLGRTAAVSSTASSLFLEQAERTVTPMRGLAGPHDPEIARAVRPRSLRAKFGVTSVCNAVNCTDLPQDALMEVNYFFDLRRGTQP